MDLTLYKCAVVSQLCLFDRCSNVRQNSGTQCNSNLTLTVAFRRICHTSEEKAGTINISEARSLSVSEFKDWINFGPLKQGNILRLSEGSQGNLQSLFRESRIQRNNRSRMWISRHSSILCDNTKWIKGLMENYGCVKGFHVEKDS
jgi:hypothetical protein